MPALALAHLLGAPVVEADVRDGIENHFPVQLQHHAQDAVGAGMLRADVEEDEVAAFAAALQAPLLGAEAQGFLLGFLLLRRKPVGLHLGGAGGMVLAQGMADPSGRHQDAPQAGMAVELDPEHVPDFPLVPVGRRPEPDEGAEREGVLFEGDLDPEVLVAAERKQVIDDGEVAGGLVVGGLPPGALVDGGQVVEHLVGLRSFFFQVAEEVVELFPRDPEGGDAVGRLLNRHPEPLLNLLQDRGCGGGLSHSN